MSCAHAHSFLISFPIFCSFFDPPSPSFCPSFCPSFPFYSRLSFHRHHHRLHLLLPVRRRPRRLHCYHQNRLRRPHCPR